MSEKDDKGETLNSIEIVYDFIIGVYDGIRSDIRDIDLSFLNLRVVKVNSKEFKDFIGELDLANFYNNSAIPFQVTNTLLSVNPSSDDIGCSPYMYAFVQKDSETKVPQDTFSILEKILLVLFPSEFKLYGVIYFNLKENSSNKSKFHERYNKPSFLKNYTISKWNRKFIGFKCIENSRQLECTSKEIKTLNSLLKSAVQRVGQLKYLQLGMDSYLSSFRQYDPAMSYICLCIAIETLSTSKTEITHRIARNCAVLNSNDKIEGSIIEYNVKQFYDLRSTIVHGGDFDTNKIVEYYPNLLSLVSRTFLELICLNIPSKELLTELISQYGYGDKQLLNNAYHPVVINNQVIDLIKVKVRRSK